MNSTVEGLTKQIKLRVSFKKNKLKWVFIFTWDKLLRKNYWNDKAICKDWGST